MPKNKVNNNIKLKSGGGILNDATDGLRLASQTSIQKTAFMDIITGDAVAIGDGTALTLPAVNYTTAASTKAFVVNTTSASTKYSSFNFTTPDNGVNSFISTARYKLDQLTNGGQGTAQLTLKIFATSAGLPTGVALDTSAAVPHNTYGKNQSIQFTFSGEASLSPNTVYCIVLYIASIVGSADYIFYGNAESSDSGATWTASTPDSAANHQAVFNITPTAGEVFPTSASNNNVGINFVGIANENINRTESGLIIMSGVASSLTGLSSGSIYYLSNTSGAISTTPGSESLKVGIAISATELLLQ